jgi:hypothetical protein
MPMTESARHENHSAEAEAVLAVLDRPKAQSTLLTLC